ncbi:GtrA family protein [Streptomyces sp. NPDC048523]|uniref:GtrA family protein n=1 Tax=unclassified Streptomyces TaxID=2593676 RepID=UPI003320983B
MSSGRHALPSRWGRLYREIAKFGMVGASGFVVNLAVFNLIRTVTDWQTVRASVLATVVAILSNYLGLRYFAYRNRAQEDRNSRRKELTLFLLFSAIGLVIENSVLYATTYGFGWDGTLATNVSKFIGIGVATLFRFWSYRTWVFRTAGSRRTAGSLPEPVVPYPEPALSGSRERI